MTDTEKAVKQVDAVLERMWKGYRVRCQCTAVFDGPKELDVTPMKGYGTYILCPTCQRHDKFSFELIE